MQMLRKANFKAGDSVFITAGAGGVGIFLLQFCRNGGASKVVTTASSAKHELVKSLGATECVDYKTEDYKKKYADRPFDIAFDLTHESIPLCSVVKEGGVIVSIVQGFNDATFTDIGMSIGSVVSWFLYFSNWSLSSATKAAKVSHHGLLLSPNAKDLLELNKDIDAGKMKTVINVFEGIEKSIEAVAMLESGRTTGKVVIKIS
jgi:NADPH:quinone reductase-like Zn-dependent oxidoreductase